jgi:parvulin-like peptidyl-prolyl isomerase
MFRIHIFILAAGLATAATAATATPAEPARMGHAEPVFAVVGKTSITQREFDNAYNAATRQKFYHGKPPEAELAALQREVGTNLVNAVLLAAEAKRRGLQPDSVAVRRVIEGYEARYKDSEVWRKERARVLPELTHKLEEDSLLRQLESAARDAPVPADAAVRAYFDKHADKFTEPEQVRIGVILLKVDPSSPKPVWQKTEEEGQAIVGKLRAGASFAETARLRSSDESSAKGGDMGYLHRGMLPGAAQTALDKLKPGEISDPVRLLEGVAVFRLEARKIARRVAFDEARERAAGLLRREAGEKAWGDLIARLRAETTIRVDESRFLPLADNGARTLGKK